MRILLLISFGITVVPAAREHYRKQKAHEEAPDDTQAAHANMVERRMQLVSQACVVMFLPFTRPLLQ